MEPDGGKERTFVPTLGLVRSDGSVKSSVETTEKGPCLVAVSSGGDDDNNTTRSGSERFEDNVSPQMSSTAIEFTSSEIEEVIKRPRLTLLILKGPAAESKEYKVANAPESGSDLFEDDQYTRKSKLFFVVVIFILFLFIVFNSVQCVWGFYREEEKEIEREMFNYVTIVCSKAGGNPKVHVETNIKISARSSRI